MLTADLVCASLRGGEVSPFWLGPLPGARERAADLIAVVAAHVGRRRAALDDALEARIAGRTDWKLDRGIVKLLLDRCTFRGVPPEEAAARRARVFALAAAARRAPALEVKTPSPSEPGEGETTGASTASAQPPAPGSGGSRSAPDVSARAAEQRALVLARAASELGVDAAQLDIDLYGDLAENEVLEAFETLEPDELVARYDLALAQAVLLRANDLTVRVERADPPRLRQLLRHVRFHGLLTAARREGDAVVLELDGPLSIFGATPRYGVRMAGFLPALLLCETWSLSARVQFGRGRKLRPFRLSPLAGLVTRARDAGAWIPELIEAFERRFAEVAPAWAVDREVPLLALGDDVVVPDFRFTHRESGWQGWLEVLGYWRRGGVDRRLRALRTHGAPRLVLALEQSLKVGDDDLKGIEGPVVPFRDVPDSRKVLKCLEALREADAAPPPRPRRRKKAAPA